MTKTPSGQYLIESFGRKQGRSFTAEKTQIFDQILPERKIHIQEGTPLTPSELFPSQCTEYWLEIGFGNGEHLAHQVSSNPHIGMIGGEVYTHGVAACLKELQTNQEALNRTRIYIDDIRILLDYLPENSLDKAFILFPDPWPKTKQQKRRLIKQDLLTQLGRVMKQGSQLHIATDHHEYAQWIVAHITASPHFAWHINSKQDWLTAPTHHIETRYQQKNKAQTDYPVFINATCL